MTHYEIFQQMLADIAQTAPAVEAAVVSHDGLVLISNISDLHKESHLAAYASVFMEYGNRMIQLPGNTKHSPVEISLNVTADAYILVTRLDNRLMLVVQATDREYIAPLMKQTLKQIERMQSLSSSSR